MSRIQTSLQKLEESIVDEANSLLMGGDDSSVTENFISVDPFIATADTTCFFAMMMTLLRPQVFFAMILIATCSLMPIRSVAAQSQQQQQQDQEDSHVSYYMIGVSGGLQDGYPDRINLDYVSPETGETIKAILLGKIFVRGYKAYLDVMEPDWRQYTPQEAGRQALINPNVFASGCYEHANEHFVYLVDSRQVLTTLMKEPRFLSITPDTGIVELKHSSPLIQEIAKHEIVKGSFTDMDRIVFPLVTAVWYQSSSLIPSPTVKKVDGANVTNFPESLALWAGAKNSDRLDYMAAHHECLENASEGECDVSSHPSHTRYWKQITKAIRQAEETRREWESDYGRPVWNCERQVRFGASKETARINYPFSKKDIQNMMESIKKTGEEFEVDFDKGKIVAVEEDSKMEL